MTAGWKDCRQPKRLIAKSSKVSEHWMMFLELSVSITLIYFLSIYGIYLIGISARYFRPPYGTIGARSRQRLAHHLKDPYIVNWSVDIEDWLWADSDTPEKQLEAFQRDIDRGGNLVVMHYLNPTTVGYFREIIQMAKATGKRIMRVDQCMMDPEAPPLLLD
jgi:hypothetical protein